MASGRGLAAALESVEDFDCVVRRLVPRRVKVSVLVLLGLVAPMGLASCHDRTAATSPPQSARAVQVTTAKEISWPNAVKLPATVSAVDRAVLASRAGGWVTRVDVNAGARVLQGTLLAEVGMPDAQGRLASARSRVIAAQAALDEAATNERRDSKLYRAHAISARQYDGARRSLITAKAEVAAAHSALAVAKSNLDYAEIRAPFAGTIVEKKVSAGDFAAAGAPLFVIAGTTPEIRAYVGARIYDALKVGAAAEVVIDGKRQPATVTRVVAAADPATRTHLVELRLQDGAVAPFGAYAELHLTLGQSPQLTVPETALARRAGLTGVFVVDSGDRVHFRLVRIGDRYHGRVAIAAGLAPGEKVVAAPAANLENGIAVRPEPLGAASAGPEIPRG